MAKHNLIILLCLCVYYVCAKPNVIDFVNNSNGDLTLAVDNVTIHTDPEVWMNTVSTIELSVTYNDAITYSLRVNESFTHL